MFDWMVWTTPVAVFFICIALMLVGMTVWEIKSPTTMRKGFLPSRRRVATASSWVCSARATSSGVRRAHGQVRPVVPSGAGTERVDQLCDFDGRAGFVMKTAERVLGIRPEASRAVVTNTTHGEAYDLGGKQ